MKEFLKYTLAAILGFFVSSVIIFFISLILFGAMLSAGQKPAVIRKNSVLKLDLNQTIPDRSSNNPFENFDPLNFEFTTPAGLNDILKNIEKAKHDDNIRGIYIELGPLSPGFATLEEIRNALIDFRESGKFIVSYSDELISHAAYYLATVSDKIYLSPITEFQFYGLRSEIMFYKNALEKLGVEVQVIRHGKFKSAVEPFIQEQMSEASREQIMTYMGAIWDYLVKGIEEERNIPADVLNRIADNLEIQNADDALRLGLIDGLKYEDELLDELLNLSDLSETQSVRFVNMSKYTGVEVKKEKPVDNKIAVVYALGDIGMDLTGGATGMKPGKIAKAIREARADSSVKAIVLRVNSHGGSVIGSEAIWREVKVSSEVKPVVASMGNVAASGGYYILAPATRVLANPVTITGSIGVFGIIPNAQELLTRKIGVTFDVVKTNEHADFGSFYRPLKPTEREYLQAGIEENYEEFVQYVADGRDMEVEKVKEIAEGRVWSGINAMDIHLIDGFGGLNEAIDLAAELAGIEAWDIKELPAQPDPMEQLLKSLTGEVSMRLIKKELGGAARHYVNLQQILSMDRIQARLPYFIELY
ncbi:MAG TPA: signal peptide peptidase SppA [Bacteroidetes bacterium]|nr:signal peptide peptidase SppA [Bacteroidota bacterium]